VHRQLLDSECDCSRRGVDGPSGRCHNESPETTPNSSEKLRQIILKATPLHWRAQLRVSPQDECGSAGSFGNIKKRYSMNWQVIPFRHSPADPTCRLVCPIVLCICIEFDSHISCLQVQGEAAGGRRGPDSLRSASNRSSGCRNQSLIRDDVR
jgi:hypothetical protein